MRIQVFQRTDNGGTDYVWFYDMQNDGFTLDTKRDPIDGSNIPDILKRFSRLTDEMGRKRDEQAFMVPVDEIRQNGYDLTFKKYQKIERMKINYRQTSEILNDISNISNEIGLSIEEIKNVRGEMKNEIFIRSNSLGVFKKNY